MSGDSAGSGRVVKFVGRARLGRKDCVHQTPHLVQRTRMEERTASLDLQRRLPRALIGPIQRNRGRVSIRTAHDHGGPAQRSHEPDHRQRPAHQRVDGVRDDYQFQRVDGRRGIMG